MIYDVVIIGKGPAGISASLYTARAGLSTLIAARDQGVLAKAANIENYFGVMAPVSGTILLETGEKQARSFGVEFSEEDIISITQDDGIFNIEGTKMKHAAYSLLLAAGQPVKSLNIINLKDFEGKGVSYCSTCDGFFYRSLKVGVIGYRDYAVHEALELKAFTDKIIIYTNGAEPVISKKYEAEAGSFMWNKKKIKKVDGTEFLERIYFDDGSFDEADGVFIAYERASGIDFARKIGIATEKEGIIVDREQKTNIEGLFAAGDCTGGFRQISTAVGEGALAGRSIIDYVRTIKKQKGL